MANKERKLSPEEMAELEKAKATILRLQGPPDAPPAPSGPLMKRRIRVLLHDVTWNQDTGEYRDNTTKGLTRDPKTGEIAERVIDMAVVEVEATSFDLACNLAWDLFAETWGISGRKSDWTPRFAEVRNLTEQERQNPPKFVTQIPDHVLPGVPKQKVFPIHALPMNATRDNLERWSKKTGLPIPEAAVG